MATLGKKIQNHNAVVGTAQSTILPAGTAACEGGQILIQNAHTSANVFIGLAADTSLSTTTRNGWWLAPGAGLVLDNPANSAITAISDTSNTPVTVYSIDV